jgi:hypothetical protein
MMKDSFEGRPDEDGTDVGFDAFIFEKLCA